MQQSSSGVSAPQDKEQVLIIKDLQAQLAKCEKVIVMQENKIGELTKLSESQAAEIKELQARIQTCESMNDQLVEVIQDRDKLAE